jgi:mannose-6-phosphate isomerase class I
MKLKPILIEKVWGGSRLGLMYNSKSNIIGECWGISAHKSNSNIIEDGQFEGTTLRELYNSNRSLFGGYKSDEFPILIKYIDAKTDLSIQVHPDDDYATINENSNGKEECWYILEAKSDTKIIIGHSASSKEVIRSRIEKGNVLEIINFYNIKPNNYFYIPPGTVHAICTGTFLLEVSQSSDITYRLYDYNRLDKGVKRELHINKSMDVIKVPDNKLILEHKNNHFTFEIINNIGVSPNKAHQFGDYISILEGEGSLGNYRVKAGDFFIVSSNFEYNIEGNLKYHISRLI